MSLCITVYTPSGIVMGSDSRATMSITTKQESQTATTENHFFDGSQKTFLLPNNFALSWSGDAIIKDEPIDIIVRRFIHEKKLQYNADSEKVENDALSFFAPLTAGKKVEVVLAGYSKNDPGSRYISRIDMDTLSIERFGPDEIGMVFTGISHYITKLLYPCIIRIDETEHFYDMPQVPLKLMTIRDCAEFVRYCIEFTANTMHFLPVVESVGGPVDVLLLTPGNQRWYSEKA